MDAHDYILGCCVIGATSAPLGSDRAVVVKPRDVAAVVKSQGGATGRFALQWIPETVANEFFKKFAAELQGEMKKNGVDADVYVTSTPPPPSGATRSDFAGGAAVGAVVAAAIYGIVRLVKHFRK